jgi:hypothetical protein
MLDQATTLLEVADLQNENGRLKDLRAELRTELEACRRPHHLLGRGLNDEPDAADLNPAHPTSLTRRAAGLAARVFPFTHQSIS